MSPVKKSAAPVELPKFADAAYPDNIPKGMRACVYGDGDYTATRDQVARLGPVRYITVLGGFSECGAADYEPGNLVFGVPGKLRTYAMGRRSMNCRARVYCDLDNLASAYRQTGDLDNVVYWIALWGRGPLTADQILAACQEHAPVTRAQLWAHQYDNGLKTGYDSSVLFGEW